MIRKSSPNATRSRNAARCEAPAPRRSRRTLVSIAVVVTPPRFRYELVNCHVQWIRSRQVARPLLQCFPARGALHTNAGLVFCKYDHIAWLEAEPLSDCLGEGDLPFACDFR